MVNVQYVLIALIIKRKFSLNNGIWCRHKHNTTANISLNQSVLATTPISVLQSNKSNLIIFQTTDKLDISSIWKFKLVVREMAAAAAGLPIIIAASTKGLMVDWEIHGFFSIFLVAASFRYCPLRQSSNHKPPFTTCHRFFVAQNTKIK